MNERRQRAARACLAGLIAVSALGLASGCDARTATDGAQTAIAIAQTALPAAQTALPAVQTALPAVQTVLPGVQATAEAGATTVAVVLSDPHAINTQLQGLLGGASIQVETKPVGAANDAVTEVAISATDTRGTLGQLDLPARQTAAAATLVVVAQYYPKASISLTMLDSSGGPLVSGTKAPGQTPSVQ